VFAPEGTEEPHAPVPVAPLFKYSSPIVADQYSVVNALAF